MKKILVVGSGGREHALAWKLIQSTHTEIVYVAPGNAGTLLEEGVENVDINVEDITNLINFVESQSIDLTIVGPEVPLVAGIVDSFIERGHLILGPNKFCAQLEGSKSFAKQFMQQFSIPTASYAEFTERDDAITYLEQQSFPCVIKADGLAAGKGVVIVESKQQAQQVIHSMLDGSAHGDAGRKLIIEDFLPGEEVSFICLVDENMAVPLASSQDHKARDNGDKGPNTGGMGAYSPAPIVNQGLHDEIMHTVIQPTFEGFKTLRQPFKGFLYAGLMISPEGKVNVLEFNCRFGDPETQPIMMRMQNDFSELCWAAVHNQLSQTSLTWDSRSALGVVMAAGGYPETYAKGKIISGVDQINSTDTKVFHAGTKLEDNALKTAGGRVLCVTALGDDIKLAQKIAYANVNKISWEDAFYRDDIGYRAVSKN